MSQLNRRELFKLGALSGGTAMLLGTSGAPKAFAEGSGGEAYPTSPIILSPFTDPLTVPQPLKPSDPSTWTCPDSSSDFNTRWGIKNKWQVSGPLDKGWQNPWSATLPDPNKLVYRIQTKRADHHFTTSKVQPIGPSGRAVIPPGGGSGSLALPASRISGFNGTFPGSMIYARYGTPCVVHFENLLQGWNGSKWEDGADFGVPSCLTHLHNGHTSPESDGNPNQCEYGYDSYYGAADGKGGNGKWYYDNQYLNWPPDGDDAEKQSTFWFHDHRLNNTGPNVYSGMVGLYLLYDEKDCGDETNKNGYQLPGVPNADTGCVDFDIPLVFYDCRFDDGVTPHLGMQSGDYGKDSMQQPPQDGMTHPDRWGKTFFGHFPNQGFVGDVMTVNGTAYPVLHVQRRKYRFRFLDASISRWYEFNLMSGKVQAAPGTQGQFTLSGAQQCMQFTQIASEGGLLPKPIVRNSFRLQPAKRREFIVDFSKYMDGGKGKKGGVSVGDEIFLTNTLQMMTGRKPDGPMAPVPLLKFIIDGDPAQKDQSVIPDKLRDIPKVPQSLVGLPTRTFVLKRSGGGTVDQQWAIEDGLGRGGFFDCLNPLARVKKGVPELWTVQNGGGGWAHPMHLHMEEHHVISRNGIPSGLNGSDPLHVDDNSKEDVIALEPAESVVIYRNFRDFIGPYVAHCHNLAHEDHAMMFGWNIE
jgi:FtsP/CotA-like multicopper oxidase with cupredoxin domain